MANRHRDPQRDVGKCAYLQVHAAHRVQQQADVHVGGSHHFHHPLVARGGQVEGDAGVFLHQRGHRRRHHTFAEGVDHGDLHMPPAQPLELVEALQRARIGLLPAAHIHQQQLAGGGQPQPAGQALEQLRAQFLLDLEDLPVDRRGRHVQHLRGLADTAAAGHFNEVTGEAGEGQHRAGLGWRCIFCNGLAEKRCLITHPRLPRVNPALLPPYARDRPMDVAVPALPLHCTFEAADWQRLAQHWHAVA
ncbi:hypothetical protein XVE_4076, partial [Xanthomonas vesicatoria ATCC 35937]